MATTAKNQATQTPSKTSLLKKGSILGETNFLVVKEVTKTDVIVIDDFGNEMTYGRPYVDSLCHSADIYTTEEKKTMTELAELFINTPRTAMTVCFITKDTPKTKKAYEAEKAAAIAKVQAASLANAATLLENLIDNPISKVIPGDERVMKGRHYGEPNELGRIRFIDMELPLTDPTQRQRWVDPRTIQYIIVNDVKYSLK